MSLPLNYQTPPPRSSRAALALFVGSVVAAFAFFLVLPPVITLVLSLTLRKRIVNEDDAVGTRHAAAAFATSVLGSLLALIVAMLFLASGRVR